MGFTCDKCGKEFSTNSALKKHLTHKVNPCDHVCRLCGNAKETTRSLNNHMKRKHQRVPRPLRKPKIVLPTRIPLEDFVSEGGTRQRLANEMSNRTKMFALKVLSSSTDEMLNHISVQLLYHIHTANSDPRYHSICKSNGSVKTFNRVNGSDACEWITQSPSKVHNVIYAHAKNLLLLALEAGAEMLQSSFCTVRGTVVFYAFDGNIAVIMCIQKATNELLCEQVADFKLDQLQECSDKHEADLNLLTTRIEEKAQNIQSHLCKMDVPPKKGTGDVLSI